MEGELKKGTARPLSMGRIGSHGDLFPLAASSSGCQAYYELEAAFALPSQNTATLDPSSRLILRHADNHWEAISSSQRLFTKRSMLDILDPLKHHLLMNRLDSKTRAHVISCLVEGC